MRGEDILTLFTRASEQFAEEYGCDAPQVTAQEAAQLLQAPWPGNVRQMVNIAERAVLQNRRGSGSIASLLLTTDAGKLITVLPVKFPYVTNMSLSADQSEVYITMTQTNETEEEPGMVQAFKIVHR